MNDRTINYNSANRANSIAKNLHPLRNNSIRGASLNRNPTTQNTQINNPRPIPKQLTVIIMIYIQYYLGRGNNDDIIRKVMKNRSIWI